MKAIKIMYWSATILIALMMLMSVYSYLFRPEIAMAFHHLGFPGYFRVELAIAKLFGLLVLVLPFPPRLKEWAYAGFFIVFVSAVIAHLSVGDPFAQRVVPVIIAIVLLGLSYYSFRVVYVAKRNVTPVPIPH